MSVIKKLVTQTANDVFTSVAVNTGLTVDGKAGWQIQAVECYWADGAAVASGDWFLNAKVATIPTSTSFQDDDEIARIDWGLQNTGGVAVAVPYEPFKGLALAEGRVTVQPFIYLGIESSGTANSNDVVFRVYYEIVKLSDLEVLRLLAGGA
jgi:hypothetical protein